jgi:tetratricopeptide (TPR) repeat protein
MARAAVKAKQQQAKAKAAHTTKARKRGRRGHAGGGNPNQDLFFVRLRRRQKWIYAFLALIFAITFAGVGVGSGNGGGLDQLYSGIFGGGGDSVSKAQKEVKKDPVKGYLQLATAYQENGDNADAITALKSYVALKPKDANHLSELGSLELTQAQTYATQYQQASQATQYADPSTPFLPTGTLGQAAGTNLAFQGASQQASTTASTLYQQATGALTDATTHFQQAAKLQPKSTTAWLELASAAQNAGNAKVALGALKHVLKIDPHNANRKAIENQIKSLQKSVAPTVKSSNSGK